MQKISSLAKTYKKKSALQCMQKIFYKISSFLEIMIILALWMYIYNNHLFFSDLNQNELITYLIFGNIIGLITGILLKKALKHGFITNNYNSLIKNPFKCILNTFAKSFGVSFISFFLALLFNIILLYFFSGNIIVNFNAFDLSIILLIISLSFITELLFIYFINLYIFWTIESKGLYIILIRIKKFLAGNYLPLNMLPSIFLFTSYAMPFAYSFFVPAQIYLKKISALTGLYFSSIQLLWIIILFLLIKNTWLKKQKVKQY